MMMAPDDYGGGGGGGYDKENTYHWVVLQSSHSFHTT